MIDKMFFNSNMHGKIKGICTKYKTKIPNIIMFEEPLKSLEHFIWNTDLKVLEFSYLQLNLV